MDTQLKKGLIEACVLSVLQKNDSYGYQLIREISPYMELSESTLYPVLRRLEKTEKVRSYTVEHDGRLRRYFSLTPRGLTALEEFRQELLQLKKVLSLIEGDIEHE